MAVAFAVHLQDACGRPVRIAEYIAPQSVRLEGEADSWPRAVVLLLEAANAATRDALADYLHRQNQDAMTLTACMAGYDLRLSGEGCEGTFAVRVAIEDLAVDQEPASVELRNGESPTVTVTVLGDPRTVRLTGGLPSRVRALLKASTLEGRPGLEWLSNPEVRASRRACLLNILAKLSGVPSTKVPLLDSLTRLFLASPDRIYAQVDSRLHGRLRKLEHDGQWAHEGSPASPCHQRLIEEAVRRGLVADGSSYRLDSFRQEAVPSVQIVVAVPPNPGLPCFADIDIDLGNPFMDARGLVVHALEVAGGGITDHLAMWRELEDDPSVRPYLAYEVVSA